MKVNHQIFYWRERGIFIRHCAIFRAFSRLIFNNMRCLFLIVLSFSLPCSQAKVHNLLYSYTNSENYSILVDSAGNEIFRTKEGKLLDQQPESMFYLFRRNGLLGVVNNYNELVLKPSYFFIERDLCNLNNFFIYDSTNNLVVFNGEERKFLKITSFQKYHKLVDSCTYIIEKDHEIFMMKDLIIDNKNAYQLRKNEIIFKIVRFDAFYKLYTSYPEKQFVLDNELKVLKYAALPLSNYFLPSKMALVKRNDSFFSVKLDNTKLKYECKKCDVLYADDSFSLLKRKGKFYINGLDASRYVKIDFINDRTIYVLDNKNTCKIYAIDGGNPKLLDSFTSVDLSFMYELGDGKICYSDKSGSYFRAHQQSMCIGKDMDIIQVNGHYIITYNKNKGCELIDIETRSVVLSNYSGLSLYPNSNVVYCIKNAHLKGLYFVSSGKFYQDFKN